MESNIKWYEDEELSIFFNTMPRVAVRYVVPSMTTLEKQSVKRFPFINKRDLNVVIFDRKKEKCYKFTIKKDYVFDGASIPKFFHRVIGANTDNSFLIPALIHDTLCERKELIDNDRELSTNVFNALLYTEDVNSFKRFLMKNSVAFYQTLFCKWRK